MDEKVGEMDKIVAVVSTFHKQRENLDLCLKLLSRGVDYIILCYNRQDGKHAEDTGVPLETARLASEVIYTNEGGQWSGEGKCVREGLKRASELGYKYTLKINGDVFFEKGENIPKLIEKLENPEGGVTDFVAPQWHNHYRFSSTMLFFGYTNKLYNAYKNIPLVGRDQLERRWHRAWNEAQLIFRMMPYAETRPDLELPEKNGMWGELLGFRHIHGAIDGKEDLLLHERNSQDAGG